MRGRIKHPSAGKAYSPTRKGETASLPIHLAFHSAAGNGRFCTPSDLGDIRHNTDRPAQANCPKCLQVLRLVS